METVAANIRALFDWPRLRLRKEELLHQHAKVLWMCGLSGSGKSTLAASLDQRLTERGFLSQVIDGDVVRKGLNTGLGYSVEDRRENIRRVAELAKLFMHCGVITLVSFISPTRELRASARSLIGEKDFLEVYINAPLEICEKRDPKGLYKQAREGRILNFTGIDSPFETPESPDIEIRTDLTGIEDCTDKLLGYLMPFIEYNA